MERTFMDPGAFDDHLANGSMSLDCPNPESTVVTSMTLEEYHSICYSHTFRGLELIIPETAKLRSVISHTASSELQRVVEVAAVPEVGIDAVPGWYAQGEEEITSEMTASGWIRYSACDVVGRRVDKLLRIKPADAVFWLSQAHYIFSLLKVTPNFEDYMFVTSVIFVIQTPPTPQPPPEGFLFLCPTEHLHVVGSNSFQWPDIPAYWSLERSGVERLGTEDAKSLGFPIIERKIHLIGKSWDASVYAGLRQFHAAKGFDPNSQDFARHFGYPLYKLSAHLDASAEHDEDGHFDNDERSNEDEFEDFNSDADNNNNSAPGEISEDGKVLVSSHGAPLNTPVESLYQYRHQPGEENSNIETEDIMEGFFNVGAITGMECEDPNGAEFEHSGQGKLDSSSWDIILSDPPSRGWNIVMTVQLGLILTLASFWLYEHTRVQFLIS